MITDVEKPPTNVTITLTPDLINSLIMRNYSNSDIARMTNKHKSTITQYIKRHYDQIMPIVSKNDDLLIAKSKRIVHQGFDNINNIMETNNFDKTDLRSLGISTGIVFDKMRILQGKSTENVEIHSVRSNRKEIQKELQDLRHRRKLQEADVKLQETDVDVT